MRVQVQQLWKQRIPPVLRDDVARELLARETRGGTYSRCRIEDGADAVEVALAYLIDRYRGSEASSEPSSRAFIRSEEERLVLADRTAERSAKLILLVRRLRVAVAVGEEVG